MGGGIVNQSTKAADDFLQGQKDCQKGIEHKRNMGPWYDRGYMTQYEREQVMTELSNQRAGRHGSC